MDLAPVRMDLQAVVKPALWAITITLFMFPEKLSMPLTLFMFPELKCAEVSLKELRGGLIKLHIILWAPCHCRLCVQMEEDEGVLEFRATAGDLLRLGETEEEVSTKKTSTLINFALTCWSSNMRNESQRRSDCFLVVSVAGTARIWHHTDPSAEKQLRNASTLQIGDPAPIFSAQATAARTDQYPQ